MKKKERTIPVDGPMSRRRFIRLGAAALAIPLLSRLPVHAALDPLPPDRRLSVFNTHTDESLSVEYCRSGRLVGPALNRINHILRDYRTGEIKAIDTRLLDLLFLLSRKIATDQPFHVICGYRSPETNALLREQGDGVAERSLHLVGQAIDIRVPGIKLRDLYRAAVSLQGGGVGFYPKSDFIHIDVGRVRTW